jgi:hypothetical protein
VYEKVQGADGLLVPQTGEAGVPDMTPVPLIDNQVNPEGTLRANEYGPTPPVGVIVLLNG